MKPEDAKPEDMVDIKRYAVEDVFTRKENFIVIGLTGLMGSGCSTIAKLLTSNFTDLKLFAPAKLNGLDDTMRDQTTIFRFAREHWCPFSVIKVRSIITTFILENFDQFTNDVYQKSDEKNTTVDCKMKLDT